MASKLTKADIGYLVDMLVEANEADRQYCNDDFLNIGEDEQKELDERMSTRSKLIGKLERISRS